MNAPHRDTCAALVAMSSDYFDLKIKNILNLYYECTGNSNITEISTLFTQKPDI